jgi:hypothetical protein
MGANTDAQELMDWQRSSSFAYVVEEGGSCMHHMKICNVSVIRDMLVRISQ